MIRKNLHRPLYREVVRDAWLMAWHDRRLWLLALVAGILQTGGIYDMLLFSVSRLSEQSRALLSGTGIGSARPSFFHFTSFQAWLSGLGLLQAAVFSALIILAILIASVIAQGALVVGLGGRIRGQRLTLRESLTFGARNFKPIALLNMITLGLIWFARFLVTIPLAQSLTRVSLWSVSAYLAAFLFFVFVSIALTTVHLFALNAIMLQQASLWEALERAFHLFKKSWVIILEAAGLFLLVGALLYLFAFVLFIIAALPVFFLGVSAILLQYAGLYWLAAILGILLFFAIMLTVGAWTITFQYAAWNRLYRRVGEGGAVAKWHRWMRWLTGHYQP